MKDAMQNFIKVDTSSIDTFEKSFEKNVCFVHMEIIITNCKNLLSVRGRLTKLW